MSQVDLPQGVLTKLLDQSANLHQFIMGETMGNIQHSNNSLRAAANKKFDQLSSVEAQANRAVTNTPIGTPNTPAGPQA